MPTAPLGVGCRRAHERDGAQAERGDADGQDEIGVEERAQWRGGLVAGPQHADPEQAPSQGPAGGGDGQPARSDDQTEGDEPAGQGRAAAHPPDDGGQAPHQERSDDEVDDPGNDTCPHRGWGEAAMRS